MFLNEFDTAGVVFGAIPAMHGGQDVVGSGLQGHVEVGRDAVRGGEQFDEVLGNVERLNGADTQAFDGSFPKNATEEIAEFDARGKVTAVSAEVDAAENDFAETRIGKALDFGENGLRRQAAGLAADKWNHAEGTARVAAVLDFQRGASVIPFPAEDRGDENVSEGGDVAGKDGSERNG